MHGKNTFLANVNIYYGYVPRCIYIWQITTHDELFLPPPPSSAFCNQHLSLATSKNIMTAAKLLTVMIIENVFQKQCRICHDQSKPADSDDILLLELLLIHRISESHLTAAELRWTIQSIYFQKSLNFQI